MAQGCYVDHFRPASFKGVSFPAQEASSQHGRRGAEGEFPFGEFTAYADLGRRIRHYHIKARYADNDHLARARELIAAVESPGPGTLVHPHLGAVRAACKKAKVSNHVIDDSGYTDIDLEFVEAQDWLGTAVGAVLPALGLGDITAAVAEMFAAEYVLDQVPIYDVVPAVETARGAIETIGTSFRSAVGLSADKKIWRISADLDTVATRGESVHRSATAWQAISNGIAAIDAHAVSETARVTALRRVVNWGARGSTLTGTGGSAQDAVISAVRILGAAYLAKAGATAVAASSQEACRQYKTVLTVLNEEADIARNRCDDALHIALRDFTAAAQTSLLDRVFGTPPIVEFDFSGGVFSIVAAHEIYGDATRFAEIEANNTDSLPFLVGPLVRAVAPQVTAL